MEKKTVSLFCVQAQRSKTTCWNCIKGAPLKKEIGKELRSTNVVTQHINGFLPRYSNIQCFPTQNSRKSTDRGYNFLLTLTSCGKTAPADKKKTVLNISIFVTWLRLWLLWQSGFISQQQQKQQRSTGVQMCTDKKKTDLIVKDKE